MLYFILASHCDVRPQSNSTVYVLTESFNFGSFAVKFSDWFFELKIDGVFALKIESVEKQLKKLNKQYKGKRKLANVSEIF